MSIVDYKTFSVHSFSFDLLKNSFMNIYHVCYGQVNTTGQISVVFHHFHTSTGLEHDDDVALVQNLSRSVHSNACARANLIFY